MKKYVIQPGDTLYQISRRTGVRVPLLLAANPQIQNPDKLMVGTTIVIPELGKPAKDKVEKSAHAQDETVPAYFGFVWPHQAAEGDTWQKIAERYGVKLEQLHHTNPEAAEAGEPAVGSVVYVPTGALPVPDRTEGIPQVNTPHYPGSPVLYPNVPVPAPAPGPYAPGAWPQSFPGQGVAPMQSPAPAGTAESADEVTYGGAKHDTPQPMAKGVPVSPYPQGGMASYGQYPDYMYGYPQPYPMYQYPYPSYYAPYVQYPGYFTGGAMPYPTWQAMGNQAPVTETPPEGATTAAPAADSEPYGPNTHNPYRPDDEFGRAEGFIEGFVEGPNQEAQWFADDEGSSSFSFSDGWTSESMRTFDQEADADTAGVEQVARRHAETPDTSHDDEEGWSGTLTIRLDEDK
ncbi:hypothetical protein AAC03nite_00110 [Alicyclobacillus acidoterrestris]|nr:hypothetical protein AAC03nite_00110 [Alicyclobacillus acidoterrestris]